MKYAAMVMRRFVLLGLIIFLAQVSGVPIPQAGAAGREINVAAAADLSTVLAEVAADYEKKTGVTVKLSFGASGALTQQIQNGAPFDVFFSADMDYPRQLIAAGRADGATLYRYAVGRLVLWVSSVLVLEELTLGGLARLLLSRPFDSRGQRGKARQTPQNLAAQKDVWK